MDEIKKMVTALVNAQAALRAEILKAIGDLRSEMNEQFQATNKRINNVENNLTERIEIISASHWQISKMMLQLGKNIML